MSTDPENQNENQNESQAGEAGANQSSEPTTDSAANSGETSVENLQAQLADAEKRVLLAHADLENFRRRNRREMQDQMRYASLTLMTEILESVDNLQRAIEAYETEPNGDGLVEGVKLVSQQIAASLENHGCKKINAVGQPFDPNLHQAIQMQPSAEHAANLVAADLRPGFQLHERVIRPSQVFVSTGPDSAKN
ncbi:nucleotide exchange factor GrpE [Mariniblastus sp.]|nr:nucleotide exchange factor GrpE [bacterium]MDA7925760.1 nucleotide exchange factor GrpE [Mariniblastus sp.]MDB4368180.1 nucleotide exchange factor GrpE [Mariniblastus sp.]